MDSQTNLQNTQTPITQIDPNKNISNQDIAMMVRAYEYFSGNIVEMKVAVNTLTAVVAEIARKQDLAVRTAENANIELLQEMVRNGNKQQDNNIAWYQKVLYAVGGGFGAIVIYILTNWEKFFPGGK